MRWQSGKPASKIYLTSILTNFESLYLTQETKWRYLPFEMTCEQLEETIMSESEKDENCRITSSRANQLNFLAPMDSWWNFTSIALLMRRVELDSRLSTKLMATSVQILPADQVTFRESLVTRGWTTSTVTVHLATRVTESTVGRWSMFISPNRRRLLPGCSS